jgi:hypothetical protein
MADVDVQVTRGARRLTSAAYALGNADTGAGFSTADFNGAISVLASGTAGGATITVQASVDGVNFVAMPGSALTLTVGTMVQIANPPPYLRVITAGGSTTAVTVIFAGRNLH